MQSSRFVPILFVGLFLAADVANAAHVDMKDPRRALGREDDIRVDAELSTDTVSSGSQIGVTYQIENLSQSWIAVADKRVEMSFDPDSRALVLTIGAEVPERTLPHLVAIAPGKKMTFTTGAPAHVPVASKGHFAAVPLSVEIHVNVLRDVTAFQDAIARQRDDAPPVPMTDDMFNRWLDANDTIALNDLPVRWSSAPAPGQITSAENRQPTPAPPPAAGGLW